MLTREQIVARRAMYCQRLETEYIPTFRENWQEEIDICDMALASLPGAGEVRVPREILSAAFGAVWRDSIAANKAGETEEAEAMLALRDRIIEFLLSTAQPSGGEDQQRESAASRAGEGACSLEAPDMMAQVQSDSHQQRGERTAEQAFVFQDAERGDAAKEAAPQAASTLATAYVPKSDSVAEVSGEPAVAATEGTPEQTMEEYWRREAADLRGQLASYDGRVLELGMERNELERQLAEARKNEARSEQEPCAWRYKPSAVAKTWTYQTEAPTGKPADGEIIEPLYQNPWTALAEDAGKVPE